MSKRRSSLILLALLGCASPVAGVNQADKTETVVITTGQVHVGAMTDHCDAKVKFTNKTSKAIATVAISIEFVQPGRKVPECTAYQRVKIPSGIEPGETMELSESIRFTDGKKVVDNKQLEARFQLLSPDGEFAPSAPFRGSIKR